MRCSCAGCSTRVPSIVRKRRLREVEWGIELKRLKDAVDNSSPQNDGENPYYTIDAGIVLESEAIAILDKIAPLYFAKVGEKFNVNSGTRNSYRQADAMYDVYMNRDRTFSLYKNKTAVNELIAVIKKGESRVITVHKDDRHNSKLF